MAGGATQWIDEPTSGTYRLPDGTGVWCHTTHGRHVSLGCQRFLARSLSPPWDALDLRLDKAVVTVSTADAAHLDYVGVPTSQMGELDAFLQQEVEKLGWTKNAEQRKHRQRSEYRNITTFTTTDGKGARVTIQVVDGVPSVSMRREK